MKRTCAQCGVEHSRHKKAIYCESCAFVRERASTQACKARIRAAKPPKTCQDCGTIHTRLSRRCEDCAWVQMRKMTRASETKYALANPEKRKALAGKIAKRRWKQRKPELTAAHAAWRKANPEKARERNARWAANNPERAKELHLKYYWADPKKARARAQLAAQRRRARLRDACSPGVTPEEWAEICEAYSDGETVRCAYCSVAPATAIDHILAVSVGGQHAPGNVAPVCRGCNSSKGKKRLLWQWVGRGIRSKDCLRIA